MEDKTLGEKIKAWCFDLGEKDLEKAKRYKKYYKLEGKEFSK